MAVINTGNGIRNTRIAVRWIRPGGSDEQIVENLSRESLDVSKDFNQLSAECSFSVVINDYQVDFTSTDDNSADLLPLGSQVNVYLDIDGDDQVAVSANRIFQGYVIDREVMRDAANINLQIRCLDPLYLLTRTTFNINRQTKVLVANEFLVGDENCYRKVDDGGSFTDVDSSLQYFDGTSVELFPTVPEADDAFYVGQDSNFSRVGFNITTANVTNEWDVEYWDGGAWAALSLTEDTTQSGIAGSLEQSGYWEWTAPVDWAATTVDGQSAFWIRANITTGSGTTPQAQYCDASNSEVIFTPANNTTPWSDFPIPVLKRVDILIDEDDDGGGFQFVSPSDFDVHPETGKISLKGPTDPSQYSYKLRYWYYDSTDTTNQLDLLLSEIFQVTKANNGPGFAAGEINLEATGDVILNKVEWSEDDGPISDWIEETRQQQIWPPNYWIYWNPVTSKIDSVSIVQDDTSASAVYSTLSFSEPKTIDKLYSKIVIKSANEQASDLLLTSIVTRAITVFQDDGGVFTDITSLVQEADGYGGALLPATPVVDDACYFGSLARTSGRIFFDIITTGSDYTITWEYYDGAAWQTLTLTDSSNPNLFIDGYVEWDWKTLEAEMATINTYDRYWIRARVSAVGGSEVGPEGHQVDFVPADYVESGDKDYTVDGNVDTPWTYLRGDKEEIENEGPEFAMGRWEITESPIEIDKVHFLLKSPLNEDNKQIYHPYYATIWGSEDDKVYYPISKGSSYFTTNPRGDVDAWNLDDDIIFKDPKYLQVVFNNHYNYKSGETNWPASDADRRRMYRITELRAYDKGYVNIQGEKPYALITGTSGDGYRYLPDIDSAGDVLASRLTDVATSIVLSDSTGFTATGRVIIYDGYNAEIVSYTGNAANTLTGVTRNLATYPTGSGASTFTAGSQVVQCDIDLYAPELFEKFDEIGHPVEIVEDDSVNNWLLGLRVAVSDLREAVTSYLDAQVEILHQDVGIGDTVYVISGGAPSTTDLLGGNPHFGNSDYLLVLGVLLRATSMTIRVKNYNQELS